MKDSRRIITARHPGTCPTCREPIEAGEKICQTINHGSGYRGRWNHARCHVAWLCDGRMIPGSQGVALYVGINALGERVGDNTQSVLGGIAAYAPDGMARARARDGARELGLDPEAI